MPRKPSSDKYANILAVEVLMADLDVSIYDLETINHVREVLDDAPHNVTKAQGFAIASQKLNHNDLAREYQYLHDKQRDAVTDALEGHEMEEGD